MVLIAQQRKKFMRRLLVFQQLVSVVQAEIALGVRGIDRVAEDDDGFNSRPADIWVDVRVNLDDPEKTLQRVNANYLLVSSGEALQRKDCSASVGEES